MHGFQQENTQGIWKLQLTGRQTRIYCLPPVTQQTTLIGSAIDSGCLNPYTGSSSVAMAKVAYDPVIEVMALSIAAIQTSVRPSVSTRMPLARLRALLIVTIRYTNRKPNADVSQTRHSSNVIFTRSVNGP